jgi:tRNA A-37 threonylcarbamoyl transferase component Bud32
VYQSVRGMSIRVDAGGTLVLPCLPGETLAALLENPALPEPVRRKAIGLAVVALAEFHASGLTHGDAMAENVLIDLEAGRASWFDFETVHDARRSMTWRRADDVRALLATCLLRTTHEQLPDTLALVLDAYGDEGVTRLVAVSFTSALRRPLIYHLGQAELSFQYFREIARLLRARLAA